MSRSYKKWVYQITAIIFMLFSLGCAKKIAKISVDGMRPIMESMNQSTKFNNDFKLVRDSMPMFMVQMDGFIEVSPENRFLLTQAAESYIGYAFLFVEDTDKKRAKKLYLKGKDYAIRVLSMDDNFKKALEDNDAEGLINALKTVHKNDIAALFFAVNGWLSYLNLAHLDDPTVLKDIPKIEAMMARLYEMDDTFKYGGIHALYGVYYASRPEMFGGKLTQAEIHFKEAFEISKSKYLVWDFVYARYYATAKKDKELFVSTLTRIIDAPDDLFPDEAFVNAAIKQKAAELLLKVNDYFL